MAFDNYGATGATAGAASDVRGRNRVSDDGSRIGFRINEDLGGGLRAFSVIETGINLDTGSNLGQSGVANSGTGFLGTREAHIGIGNSQAEIRFGRQNVYWGNGKIEDQAANMMHGGVINAYTASGAGYINVPAARVNNAVQVVLNKDLVGTMFAGSSVWYGIGDLAEQTAAGADAKAKSMGFTLKAEQGPFAAQYDYGQNKNNNNSVTTSTVFDSTTTGAKLGLAYFYAPTSKISFINTQLKQEFTDPTQNATPIVQAATGITTTGFRKQASNSFLVQHDLGGGNIVMAQYVIQGNVKNLSGAAVADTGSTAYSFGYRKELSKRTSLSTSYSVISNDAKNNMMSNGGGQAPVAYVPNGATVKLYGFAVQHNF